MKRQARLGRVRGRAPSRQRSGIRSRCRCSRRQVAVCPRSNNSSSRALLLHSARLRACRSEEPRKAHSRLRLPAGQEPLGFPRRVCLTRQASSSWKRVRPGRQDQRQLQPAAVRCHRATKRCSTRIRPCKLVRQLPVLELLIHSNSASHHCQMLRLPNKLATRSILNRQLHSSNSRCRANRCSNSNSNHSSSRSRLVGRPAT